MWSRVGQGESQRLSTDFTDFTDRRISLQDEQPGYMPMKIGKTVARAISRSGRLLLYCVLIFSGSASAHGERMDKRWLFVWRNMSVPEEVDRMMARFPAAQAAGWPEYV